MKAIPQTSFFWIAAFVLVLAFLISGCSFAEQAQVRTFRRERQQNIDYYLSLIYRQKPELRGEPLEFMNGHFGGVPPRGADMRTAQQLDAKFRFERDGESVYRVVLLERAWPAPEQPPKISVVIRRERAKPTPILKGGPTIFPPVVP